MSVKIDVKFEGVVKDLEDFKKHVFNNAELGAEKALKKSLEELKTNLRNLINNDIKISQERPKNDIKSDIDRNLNVAKSKSDIIKYLFDIDLKQADFYQKSIGSVTVNDNCNVFTLDDERIKTYQTAAQGATLESELDRFRNRLAKGIIIDKHTGRMYKLQEKDIAGLKVDCSSNVGATDAAVKKFEDRKNTGRIRKRKPDSQEPASSFMIKKENLRAAMANAIPIDDVVNSVLAGDYQTAKALLSFDKNDDFLNTAIKRVDTLNTTTAVPTDLQALLKIQALINNLKIRKEKNKNDSKYILMTDYDEAVEQNIAFMQEFDLQIKMWTTINLDIWYKAIVDQVIRGISKYDTTKISRG